MLRVIVSNKPPLRSEARRSDAISGIGIYGSLFHRRESPSFTADNSRRAKGKPRLDFYPRSMPRAIRPLYFYGLVSAARSRRIKFFAQSKPCRQSWTARTKIICKWNFCKWCFALSYVQPVLLCTPPILRIAVALQQWDDVVFIRVALHRHF